MLLQAFLSLALGLGAAAFAEAPAEVTGRAAPSVSAARPVALEVHSDGNEEALAAFRASVKEALQIELEAGVVEAGSTEARGTVTITLRPSRGELAVSYDDPTRGLVGRVVPAPSTPEDSLRVAVRLAGNLVRDDARELLRPAPPVRPAPLIAIYPDEPPVPDEGAGASAQPPVVALKKVAPPPAAPVSVRPKRMVAAALMHPLALSADQPGFPHFDVRLALNLLYGRVGALHGFSLGTVSVVDGSGAGVALAVVTNRVAGDFEGLQAGGLANRTEGLHTGVQGALFWNQAGAVEGLQVALGNHAGWGGGAQVGVLNLTSRFRGVQVGLINVADHVRGLQIGIINVSDDVDGLPIGVFSLSKEGGIHPVLWMGSTARWNGGIQFATRRTHSTTFWSFDSSVHARHSGPGFSLGVRAPLGLWNLEGDLDLGTSYLFASSTGAASQGPPDVFEKSDRWETRLQLLLRAPLMRRFSVFAGGGLAAVVRQAPRRTLVEIKPEVIVGVSL